MVTTFNKASELAQETHGGPLVLAQTRWAWADRYAAMAESETVRLINALGEVTTVTRTEAGWTIERSEG